MNFDFTKTLTLVKGGLMDHEATWKSYLQECPGWQATAINLTGPLILANIVIGVVLGRMLGGFSPYGYHSNFLSALFFGLVLAVLGFIAAVFVFNFMAGVFKGKSDFPRAFAAVSLAAIPSWLAGMVAALVPGFIGMLIAMAGGILSLVFLYKIMPLALEIPDEKRTVHFIVSIIIIIVLNMIVGSIFGGAMLTTNQQPFSTSQSSTRSNTGSGMFGTLERQAQLMQAAQDDRFEPPEDGKLSKSQVIELTKVVNKTRAMHAQYAEKMDAFNQELKEKEARGETRSMLDIKKAYSGFGGAMSANNAEMEIVKTGGGNWAEHLWVKNQLRTAHIQQGEGSEAIEHNYKLRQEYAEDIDG